MAGDVARYEDQHLGSARLILTTPSLAVNESHELNCGRGALRSAKKCARCSALQAPGQFNAPDFRETSPVDKKQRDTGSPTGNLQQRTN